MKPNYLWFSTSEDLSKKKTTETLNLLSEVNRALPFYIGCPYLFFHRPHQRDHQWTDGLLPPWTSPASCWSLLPAIISTPAGGERNSTPGELSSCSVGHVFRCCQRVVLACLVSVRGFLHFLERLLAEVHTGKLSLSPVGRFHQWLSALVSIKSQHREVISKIWEMSWVFFFLLCCESFPNSSCKCTSPQCQIKLQYYEHEVVDQVMKKFPRWRSIQREQSRRIMKSDRCGN